MRKVIKLQTPTVLWPGGGTISLSSSVHTGFSYVSQTEIDTAEQLAPEPSASEAEMAIKNQNRYKSPCIDKIPAELINPSATVGI
jgi:hypothetical protein